MDFSEALVALKAGKRIARKSVRNDVGNIKFYLRLKGDVIMAKYDEKECRAHEFMAIRTCDLLADDWIMKEVEVEEEAALAAKPQK